MQCRSTPAKITSKVFTAAVAAIALISAQSAAAEPAAVAGQFLVKYAAKARLNPQERRLIRDNIGVRLLTRNDLSGSQLVESASADGGIDHTYAKEMLAGGLLEYIEPNYVLSIHGAPNDQRFAELWGMNNSGQTGGTADVDIDAPEAWELTTGSEDTVVGVVDTGIDYNHEDLAANLWRNPGELPNNGIDDDGNGVVDDVFGFNALNGSGNPLDDNGHGTHCAGSIGAIGNNARGVAGASWNVRLLALKFLDSSGFGSTQGAVSAIEYAVNMRRRGVNLRVLSNSWGGGAHSQALEDAIRVAEQENILFVAASGNNATDIDSLPAYPAAYNLDNVLSVAAVDHNGNLATFSNYGANNVDVAAPGVNILSTYPGNRYAQLSGTSMATPHVSGVAALVLSREPDLTTALLKERLTTTVKPLAGLTGLVGFPGIVSAARALTNTRDQLPQPPPRVRYSRQSKSFEFSGELGEKLLDADDGYAEVALPFEFTYYGESFKRLAVSANGRAIPLRDGDSLPAEADYANRLREGLNPYHDDLYPSPHSPGLAGVWALSDQRSVVVTWIATHYGLRNKTEAAMEIRFQLVLHDTGEIEFRYLDADAADAAYSHGASATVGIAPVRGSRGEQLLVSHNIVNAGDLAAGRAISFAVTRPATPHDFDGDGLGDLAVWRPEHGMWHIAYSSHSYALEESRSIQLGLPGDHPRIANLDSDALADLLVWRPETGMWYYLLSSEDYSIVRQVQWGLPGDTPLAADVDGDLRADLVVFRPSTASFFTLLSSSGFDRTAALAGSRATAVSVSFGGPGNDPVLGDFTGDGSKEFVAVWQLIRFWTVRSATGAMLFSLPWGMPGDTPLVCNRDGDAIDDRYVVRVNERNELEWYGVLSGGGVEVVTFGSLGDIPRCSTDYDGDGVPDLALFRPQSGEHFLKLSGAPASGDRALEGGSLVHYQFGLPGDIPPTS